MQYFAMTIENNSSQKMGINKQIERITISIRLLLIFYHNNYYLPESTFICVSAAACYVGYLETGLIQKHYTNLSGTSGRQKLTQE